MTSNNRKLARHVTVDGVTYGPDDDVPADAMAKITNPKAWQPLDVEPAEAGDAKPSKAGTAGGARLATAVTVGSRTYLPTAPIPDDVAAQIRNPKAWEGGKVPTARSGKGDTETDKPAEAGTGRVAKAGPAKAAPTKAAGATAPNPTE